MSAVPMASVITESYIKWAEVNVNDMPFLERLQVSSNTKRFTGFMTVYNTFLVAAALLAIFFALSLVLAFTTQYFLDWGSALVGFLGTAGLSAVAWFSKREVQS